ncbi:tyrosine--tRNA ligase [Nocardioides plantarum]|uniref:Tyrosine--tRNA ligase n=1 Tax=Nocardioides plantarum TaxID=29299 RepID=A0ABV5KE66_9ACTN|nr:tyrosine--tRNA ligase [Nocardioides plantarum]
MPVDPDLLADLQWRGLVAHSTDPDALREALDGRSIRFYVGFDPTAPSLHMGNLVQITTARRLQDAGHTPYLLVGGATGMIGDPRDSGERTLNSAETVQEWVGRIRRQIEPFLSFEGDNAATMVNNLDWTDGLSVIDFLRDVGKHFPINRMLARDTVKRRLESGISFTEFSYVLLQSMDFLELHRRHGVDLQFGGSDQWGNITGGAELIRRATGDQVHAFATPLVTKADGTKYGKTEGGALWLDPSMLSPYAFHQFWLNVEDEKVDELLRIFTFLPRAELEELAARHAEKPFLREAQKVLADEVTTFVHGAAETEEAKVAAVALFGSGDLHALSARTLKDIGDGLNLREVELDGAATTVGELFARSFDSSLSDALRTINDGGAYLNNVRIDDARRVVTAEDRLHDRWVVLRRGKKRYAVVDLRL